MNYTNQFIKAGIFFLVIFAAAFLFTSCYNARLTKGAGCQNGYVGYGEQVHILKGGKR